MLRVTRMAERVGARALLLPAILLLTGGIFFLDFTAVLGPAVWAFYLLPLVLTFWLAAPQATFGLAATLSALLLASALSPYHGALTVTALVNRSLAMGVIWLVAVLIRQRRTAEAVLLSSQERYRLLFEKNPHPMWVYDGTTLAFLAVNEAAVRQYGYAREEFLGMTILEIRPPEEIPVLLEYLDKERRGSGPDPGGEGLGSAGVWRHRKKDGTLIEVEITRSALRFNGRDARLVLAHDITERKSLEAQFHQAQKMEAIGLLAGGIAHDFNNLLMIVIGNCQLLSSQPDLDAPLRSTLEQIKGAGERAGALTQQLLAFSRRQVLQPTVLDLNALVTNLGPLLQRVLGEDIDVALALDSHLGPVRADPGQLEQVLMNLAVNARDAMPEGGKLTIETANVEFTEASRRGQLVSPGPYVRLAVSDSGCGMDTQTQARIFEPFFTTKARGKGTGLGLSTVYGIIKQNGGYIFVYSEPGQGATFKIYLPREAAAVATVVPEPASRAGVLGGTETVLVVEDEPGVRAVVRDALRQGGYTVLEARHGFEALLIANQHAGPIQLLVTDVVMPQMNGREVAERLRPGRPEMHVLYLSGYAENAIVHHGILDPGTAFLQKPCSPEALLRKVREVLTARAG